MVAEEGRKHRYVIDAEDMIISVSDRWLAFARENGAADLSRERVVGNSLWGFIADKATRDLYQEIFARVRTIRARMVLPFRCDSPRTQRSMRLELMPLELGQIQLDGIVESTMPTNRLALLDREFPRSRDQLTMCSLCKRALIESLGWLDVEQAVARLNLFDSPRAPKLRYAVCALCLETALQVPLSNNHGES